METKKISELTEVTSPTSTDVFPIVNGGETKKVQLTNIKNTLGITAIDTRLTTAETDIDNLNTYSTEEKVIGKWINGKPIYRKVVSYTGSLNSVDPPTNILIAHNISNVSTVVDVRGFMTSYHRLPFLYQGAIINILYVNETNISLTVTNSMIGSRTLYFILEYTKTTD